MNLVQAFGYQNTISSWVNSISDQIRDQKNGYKVRETHLRKKVNPDAEDEVVEVEVDDVTYDVMKLIAVGSNLVREKEALTEAINKAKANADEDIDAMREKNKLQRYLTESIARRLRCTAPAKQITRTSGYKLDVEGKQTTYLYDKVVETTPMYDVDNLKRIREEARRDVEETSAKIDSMLRTIEVDFEPSYDVFDSFFEMADKEGLIINK